jgi:hypothetical protein
MQYFRGSEFRTKLFYFFNNYCLDVNKISSVRITVYELAKNNEKIIFYCF